VTRESALRSRSRDEEQELASGRREGTPFAVVGFVALAIAIVVSIVVAIAFVVIWLA
jgi:hypothetical protein